MVDLGDEGNPSRT
jgi:hypothetical protein